VSTEAEQINIAVKVGACESNQTNINIRVRNEQGKKSTPGTGSYQQRRENQLIFAGDETR
jgi:hypothetical protein